MPKLSWITLASVARQLVVHEALEITFKSDLYSVCCWFCFVLFCFVCLFIYFIYLFIYLFLFVCLFVYLFVCLFVCFMQIRGKQ